MNAELLDDDIRLPNDDSYLSHEYASLKYRLSAFIIDMIILGVLLKSFSVIFGSIIVSSNWTLLGIASAIFYMFMVPLEVSKMNGSLGKHAFKLNIFNDRFNKISITQSFLRTTFKIVLVWIYFFYETFPEPISYLLVRYNLDLFSILPFLRYILLATGFVYFAYTLMSINKDPKHQSWYDKIAGTVVLREIKKTEEAERN